MHRYLWVSFRTSMQRTLAERGGFIVSTGFYLAVVAVVGSLWRAAADGKGGTIAGYGAASLFWYIAATEAATVSLNMRLIDDIGTDISGGAIASEMLRPVSLVAVRMASEFGRALPRLTTCTLAGAVMSWIIVGAPPGLVSAAMTVVALALAIGCNIAAQHAFAAIAFWIRDARSAWFLYQKLVFVLGGMLLPIEVLPGPLRLVARLLPFVSMAYIPGRFAAGHVEPLLLLQQVGWLVALLAIALRIFATGERRLQVVGG